MGYLESLVGMQYEGAILIGASLGILYVALSYMVGYFLTNEKIKAYAKIELGEVIVALLIAVLVASFYTEAFYNALLGQPDPGVTHGVNTVWKSTISKIDQKIEKPIEESINSLTESTYSLSKYMSYYYNIHLPVPYASPMFSDSPTSGFGPLQMQLFSGLDTVMLNLFLVKAVKTLYVFLSFIGTLLLPLGFILRFLPPFRKVAGLMIGISLAVHFVFPVSVLYTTQYADDMMPAYVKNGKHIGGWVGDPGNPPLSGMICSEVMQGVYTVNDIVGPAIITAGICIWSGPAFAGCFSSLYNIMQQIWYFGLNYGFPTIQILPLSNNDLVLTADEAQKIFNKVLQEQLPAIVEVHVASLFMIIVQIATTFVLAKNFSEALGAEGQIYGVGRLI